MPEAIMDDFLGWAIAWLDDMPESYCKVYFTAYVWMLYKREYYID
jgi:hypothetical protein